MLRTASSKRRLKPEKTDPFINYIRIGCPSHTRVHVPYAIA
jgi:hypothetical protein